MHRAVALPEVGGLLGAEREHYDVTAKPPEGSTREQRAEMRNTLVCGTRSLPPKPRRTMMRRRIAVTSLLMFGLWNPGGAPTAVAQSVRDAQGPTRTLKRSIVEGPSASGGMT